jgi:polar amino acid transport system ATP-binding protein
MSDNLQSDVLLTVSDLKKDFGALQVLRGISFCVEKGECVAIIGPSGSGKSTCLRSINFLETPTGGAISLNGQRMGEVLTRHNQFRRMTDRELAPQRAQIGMVFQLFYLWPHLTARENVALQPHRVGGLSKQQANELADQMLAKVHLSDKADEYPDRLSGGQQQRVAIARALAQKPSLMLFDEPTSALDPELVGEVLGVIRELADEGRSMVLVTHEIRFAREVADRIIFMDQGLIVEVGEPQQIADNPQSERLKLFLRQMSPRDVRQ